MHGTSVVLRGDFAYKRGPKARIQKEALILRRLDHPHVIKLETVYLDNLVLPRASCHLTHDMIVTSSQLVTQLLDAVAYIHSQHIIHGDIKPENILCDQGRITLCDFGVSMFLHAVNEIPVQCARYRSPYDTIGPHLDLWPVGQIILDYCSPKWIPVGHKCQAPDVMAPSDYKPLVLHTEAECELQFGVSLPSHRSEILALDINDRPLIHDMLYRYFKGSGVKCWSPKYIQVYKSAAMMLCGDPANIWLL